MSDSFADSVADNIRAHARRAGVKQHGLAERLGFSPTSVAQRWRGDVSWKLSELPAVASALHVDLGALLGFDVAPPEPVVTPAPDLSGIESRLSALEEALRTANAATTAAVERALQDASRAAHTGRTDLTPASRAQQEAGAALEVSTASLGAVEKAQRHVLKALEASSAGLAVAEKAHADARAALESSSAALAPVEKANKDADSALRATATALASLEQQDGPVASPAVAAIERLHAEVSALSTVDEALHALRAEVAQLS